MFLLSRPSDSRIRAILTGQSAKDFSYPDVGATRGKLPAGYLVLHGSVVLGRGSTTFIRSIQELCRWRMFDVPSVDLCWPDTPVRPEEPVAIVVQHFGFWSLNFCKIVYVVDEDGPIQRFGFAYGTLPEHAEQGEERFTVEWDRSSDQVSYDILSFSRPGNLAVRGAYPLARWLQRRFLRNSLAAMASAVRPSPDP